MTTVAEARQMGRAKLAPLDSPALDVDVLLCHALGWSRERLFSHRDQEMTREQEVNYESLLSERQQHRPVAYITGRKEWYGLYLHVDERVLIPRPETELLVELAVTMIEKETREYTGRKLQSIVDVGTGSGAIAIAIASALPMATITATDVSPEALQIARQNVATHALAGKLRLLQGNLLRSVQDEPDMIVANLPYVPDDDWHVLSEDVGFEPQSALLGGPSGLDFIEWLLQQVADRRWEPIVLLEIDPRQVQSLTRIVASIWPAARVSFHRDLTDRDRVALVDLRGHDVGAALVAAQGACLQRSLPCATEVAN